MWRALEKSRGAHNGFLMVMQLVEIRYLKMGIRGDVTTLVGANIFGSQNCDVTKLLYDSL